VTDNPPFRLLTSYLATNGPTLSSEVIDYLFEKGISRANARKAIERSRGSILRLLKIRFAHNQQFLFLAAHYKKAIFWERLITAFQATNSIYGHAVSSLIARDGSWPEAYFDIISGSPERLTKHISSSTVLKKLIDIELIETVVHPETGLNTSLVSDSMPNLALDFGKSLRSRLIAEDILLSGLKDWLRNTGLGSSNKVLLRSLKRQPKFGQFKWDFSAPSFVYPIRTLQNAKKRGPVNGFVVGDVLLAREIEEKDLAYFIVKTATMRNQRNTRPFLAIFVAERFTNLALKAGRNKGLLLATTETLFGREVASGLSQLIQVLNNAAAAIGSNPALVSELFEKLDNLKGASLNLRGWLFELVAAHMLKTDGWNITSVGELRRDPQSGELAEVDVLATKGNDTVALECKGYVTNDVPKDEVERWLTRSVPRIRASLLSEKFYQQKQIEYQFWTTSKFTPDALAYLKVKKVEIKKFTFSWLEGPDVTKFSKTTKSEYATRILREQYQLD
jgi:hypothetical protein